MIWLENTTGRVLIHIKRNKFTEKEAGLFTGFLPSSFFRKCPLRSNSYGTDAEKTS
jgi:hypothetical protein